jgi:hypothetical protein
MPLKATIAAAAMLVVAGCGSAASAPAATAPTSPTAAATQALSFCGDVAELRAALQTLTPVHGSIPSSSQMKATAQEIQTNLAGLGRQTQWQTQIDNLRTAVTNMNAAADNIAASPGARGATSQVRIAVAQVNDALRRLLAAVGSRCPVSIADRFLT